MAGRAYTAGTLALSLLLLDGCPASTHSAPDGGQAGTQAVAGRGGAGGTGQAGAGQAGTSGGSGGNAGSGGAAGHAAGSSAADGGMGCVRTGCSGQGCGEASAEPVITTCEFLPEYACYQDAACERQPDGTCGHTPSAELSACLASGGVASGLQWFETCGAPVCNSQPMDDPALANCKSEAAGASCATRDASCDLVNACGTTLLCTDVDPTQQGCPRSRARYKTDIAYLDDAEREQAYRQLLAIPLASYSYQNDPAATPQLGFLLEDVEPSPAARGDRVNMYGYLSMAVAAVQVQARQIEALQQELRTLRERPQDAAQCSP